MAAGGAGSVIVGMLWPAPAAEALSCGCVSSGSVLAPQNGATGVPVDAFIWMGSGYGGFYSYYGNDSELALLSDEGDEIDLELESIDVHGAELTVGIPAEELEPATLYQVWDCRNDVCDRIISSFTTGTMSDDEPPEAPTVSGENKLFDNGRGLFNCGGIQAIELSFDSDDIVLVDLGDATLSPTTFAGSVSAATNDGNLTVGLGLCADNWPAPADDTITPRYASYDLSGNFSGWQDGEPLELPQNGCGCTTNGDSTPGWAWLVGVLFVFRRRR